MITPAVRIMKANWKNGNYFIMSKTTSDLIVDHSEPTGNQTVLPVYVSFYQLNEEPTRPFNGHEECIFKKDQRRTLKKIFINVRNFFNISSVICLGLFD